MSDPLPVLFVHGIRLSGAAWAAALERVRAERPAIAVDLPGHGARRGARFTLPSAVEAVAGAVGELGGRALVVGHSMGGYLATATAGQYPERVAGLVAVGCTYLPSRVATMPFLILDRALRAWPDGGERISGRILDALLPPEIAQAVKRGGIASEVIPDVIEAIRGYDVLASLARYPGPTWLINGSHDHFRRHERRFLAAANNGRLLTIPGAGHYLPMTRPTEFARQVLDIARAVTPPGPADNR